MTTGIRETEQKYEAGPDVILPSLDGLPQVAEASETDTETLTAEHYGTPRDRRQRPPGRGERVQLRPSGHGSAPPVASSANG